MTSSYVVCDVDEALDVLGLRVSGESREEEDDGAGVVAVGHGRLLGLLLAPVQGDLAAVGEEDHLGAREQGGDLYYYYCTQPPTEAQSE